MRYLRNNTATRVTVGPFLDKTDGITPETALTVTATKLTFMVDTGGVPTLVLDTNPTASAGANDMVHVTGDDAGFYDLELAAADVNYLGRAMLALTDAANHCPVFHEFMIIPAMIYDSVFLGSDRLDVNVTHFGDTAQTPRDIGASVLLSSGTGTGQLSFTSGILKVDVDTIKTNPVVNAGTITFPTTATLASTTNITAITGNITGNLSGSVGSVTGAVGSVTGNVGGNVTGSVGSVTGAVGSVTGAVGSVTGAVGSVTGNVGGNVVGTVASVVGAVGSVTGLTASDVGAIKAKTDNLPAAPAAVGDIPSASAVAAAVLTTALTEAYAANGVAPTLTQAMLAVHQVLMDFAIAGTAYTVRKLDGATTAFVITLDDATTPTEATRS